jgi:nucleoside-diphosphate-sugar epimerase
MVDNTERKKMKKALVCGAGGFIGGHLVKRLKDMGYWVRGVDIKEHEYTNIREITDEFVIGDLRDPNVVKTVMHTDSTWGKGFDEVYQLAADMGGAGYIFTGENDANVMHNSATINLNVVDVAAKFAQKPRIFYSSSACMYPAYNQEDPENPKCSEESAYPAAPDSEYGWEKLFSERLYLAYARNHGLEVRIARYHNIFGPQGSWNNGKEKAPAALSRKIAMAEDGGTIEVWGDGKQTRSFLYVDECLEATLRLMHSDFTGPVNIGSEEMVSINQFVEMIAKIAGKTININHITGPVGVRGRNSDNTLYNQKLGWKVSQPLSIGLEKTYQWICKQATNNNS